MMCLAVVLLAAAMLAPPPASLDVYEGRYQLVPPERDPIRPAIEKVVAKMNFLIRGIARGRLRKTQIPFPAIEISSSETEFRIRHKGGTDVGHGDVSIPIKTKAPDGESITVRLQPGPPLVQSYESEEGKRENTYVLSRDGNWLTLRVRITSPRLPSDIEYELAYQRVEHSRAAASAQ